MEYIVMKYNADLSHPDLSILTGHLKMGGTNPQGVEINANNRFLTLNGEPWLPVMGEFHFSRYPNQLWRQELLKMKAGGITIAATYIFWIHHEEIEGEYRWTGDCDLHCFISLCAELGLYAYPRIGPWAHGECRNGGFPDWVVAKCGDRVRQDDPQYLAYVKSFYSQVSHQLSGLLWKDGGPVIGVQLENELLENASHILTLKNLARQAGIEVPLYTMTGWGPAQVPQDEVIPLFGGYPDAFWDRQVEGWSRGSRKHYFFSLLRDDNTIGADLNKAENIADLSYLERYPFATCELGGGMQVAYHRRPYILPEDVSVPPLTKVGSGSNLPGYYMYHGGSHPLGQLSTLQESQATGYWNDVPVISYDFQAAIGEYGQLRDHYHGLRLLHLFLNDFGRLLAPLPPVLPERMPSSLEDRQTLRWAVRTDGFRGFVFINNYQRVEALPEHEDVQLELGLKDGKLEIPAAPAQFASGAYMIWPFNLDMNGVLLQYATAQLVCRLEDGDTSCYVFAAAGGVRVEFAFEPESLATVDRVMLVENRFLRPETPGSLVTLRSSQGQTVRVLLLSQEQARQCWKANIWGQDRIFLSPADLMFDGDSLSLRSRRPEDFWFSVYPAPPQVLTARGRVEGVFTRYTLPAAGENIPVAFRKIQAAGPARSVPTGPLGVAQAPEEEAFEAAEIWEIDLPTDAMEGVNELFLNLDYIGDAGRLYLDGRLIADDFYNGKSWEVGLKRFAPRVPEKTLTLKLLPLRKDAPIYLAPKYRPDFSSASEAIELRGMHVEAEYERLVEPQCSK
jgi:beta-galactosidase